jgi:galactokinase
MDAMCEIARAHPACYGARMMGGGFGGSAVGLVRADEVNGFIRDVAASYEARTGIAPEMYVGTAAPGSTVERIGEA